MERDLELFLEWGWRATDELCRKEPEASGSSMRVNSSPGELEKEPKTWGSNPETYLSDTRE